MGQESIDEKLSLHQRKPRDQSAQIEQEPPLWEGWLLNRLSYILKLLRRVGNDIIMKIKGKKIAQHLKNSYVGRH